MGWGAATRAANKGGGGRYLRAEDGVQMRLAFTGEPYTIYKRWDGSQMHIEDGPGPDVSQKFLLEVVNLNAPNGVQQLELSKAAFRSIGKKVGDDPAAVSVLFEREGTGKNTSYHVMLAGKLSDADKAVIAEAVADQMWSLDEVEGAQAFDDEAPAAPSAAPAPDASVPF